MRLTEPASLYGPAVGQGLMSFTARGMQTEDPWEPTPQSILRGRIELRNVVIS